VSVRDIVEAVSRAPDDPDDAEDPDNPSDPALEDPQVAIESDGSDLVIKAVSEHPTLGFSFSSSSAEDQSLKLRISAMFSSVLEVLEPKATTTGSSEFFDIFLPGCCW
jgi:hypothetical protein